MEKICLARRRWESNKAKEIKVQPSVSLSSSPLSHINIGPKEQVISLLNFWLAVNGKDYPGGKTKVHKFNLEVIYDSVYPVKVTVYITPTGPEGDEQWLSAKEMARLFKISATTVYRQLLRGNLAGIKVGRQWRVLKPGLNREKFRQFGEVL